MVPIGRSPSPTPSRRTACTLLPDPLSSISFVLHRSDAALPHCLGRARSEHPPLRIHRTSDGRRTIWPVLACRLHVSHLAWCLCLMFGCELYGTKISILTPLSIRTVWCCGSFVYTFTFWTPFLLFLASR